VAEVGWEPRPGEGHLDVLLRGTVLGLAGAFGHPEVVVEAQRRFAGYVADPASLRPDLRVVVVGIAGQEGDRATYDTLWELARRSELQEEKLRLLRSLGRFRAPELLRLTLERSLGPEVRSQDSISVIGAVAGNRRGRGLAWDFVREHWAELDRRYGRGGFAITSLVAFTGGFNTAERAAEVEAFFAAHPVPSAERAVQQALERIRLNVAWLERNDAAVAAWLDRRR
jgi:puromycin-sensitive aminopeptidase